MSTFKLLHEEVLISYKNVHKYKSWRMMELQDQVQKIHWADGWTPEDFAAQFKCLVYEKEDVTARGTFDENAVIAADFCDPEWLLEHEALEMTTSRFHKVWKETFPVHYAEQMVSGSNCQLMRFHF